MPLRDHFRPPLSPSRHWQGFHSMWAGAMALDLNRHLPPNYVAEPNVQYGIEIDVATLEGARALAAVTAGDASSHDPSVASLQAWTPPAPTQTVPFTLTTDIVEVAIYHTVGGAALVAAIEIVSPANKDRPAHREAFAAKCKAYLQEGLGLVVVDVVTDRTADLHAEIVGTSTPQGKVLSLYAAAYHPVEQGGDAQLDIWIETLALGQPLPTLPLWLRGGPCMPIDLESTYEQVRTGLRIP